MESKIKCVKTRKKRGLRVAARGAGRELFLQGRPFLRHRNTALFLGVADKRLALKVGFGARDQLSLALGRRLHHPILVLRGIVHRCLSMAAALSFAAAAAALASSTAALASPAASTLLVACSCHS